ncbi:MAG: AbrB/MazE/SpoVT family DNA-binding domain-containing protein [Candidatus Aenigmarchaeota archaeon]|nr:AbrB/MazE/SpoVT family DNA-binding domain-containing protein [Candidatus Aenigmarchaeota archaeon]
MRDLWDAEHRCTNCNSIMKKDNMSIEGMEIRAWKCSKCDEIVLHPEDAQKMLVFNKIKKGISVKVGMLGESLVIRFPKEVADFYNIKKGGEVVIKADSKKKLELDVKN